MPRPRKYIGTRLSGRTKFMKDPFITVHGVRVSERYYGEVIAEADRLGITPGRLIARKAWLFDEQKMKSEIDMNMRMVCSGDTEEQDKLFKYLRGAFHVGMPLDLYLMSYRDRGYDSMDHLKALTASLIVRNILEIMNDGTSPMPIIRAVARELENENRKINTFYKKFGE